MSDRLRIALVVHDFNRHGGHARYTAELAARFKRDHEVHVFANTFDEPDPAGLTFHRVPAVRRGALATILSFVVPGTYAVGGGFDVVHAQGLCGLRHDLTTAHFVQPGWYAAADRAAGRLTWKQRANRAILTPLERLALTTCSRRVIAISDRVRDDLARFYHRKSGVTVVYHGVDLDTFHPRNKPAHRGPVRAELGVPADAYLGLFVGNLQKGAAAAIRATAVVPGAWLAIVSGSDRTAEEALVRELGVADRVRFAPLSRQVQRYFAAADVFLFPTVYEPFGMVISEAMAAGVPPITSRPAGASELVRHGDTGWLTDDPWDVPALAAGLRHLADPAARERMGAAARAAIEPYTWDRAAAETLAVYRDIAATKRGRR